MTERPWAVVVRPDATHVVRALGPIKDQATAYRVVEDIERLEDAHEAALEANGMTREMSWLAQAVPLESVADFKRELAALVDEERRHD